MLQLFNKLIDANERELKRLSKIVSQINALEPKMKKLTDEQMLKKSDDLKKQFEKKGNLDELLPESYALVREATSREVNQRHFDVQLIAGIALHEGKIAEQKTGEGKTNSAVPALFLNALTGEGAHLITVNDYLARRDCGWNGPIFHALGLSCAVIIHDASFIYDPKYNNKEASDSRLKHLRPVSRREAYQADITYGTNNEFGFDYLRDNMAQRLEDKVQRGHHYAIVDEVDSILIDEARTPLIISSPNMEATDKYVVFAQIVKKLNAETDYVIDEKMKTANLTEEGIQKIEKILKVNNLYEEDFATLHHIEQALKAITLFLKDRDYVVRDGEVIIVDEFTGRLMPGRRYSEGLHQALEAKEGVTIQQESKTWATISLQNYFRMYQKLAGMTGTAATEAEEFHKIYKLDVVVVPTNRPMVRKDEADLIYKTAFAKFNAVVNEIEEVHKSGQPILVGTTSIEKNEYLSKLLQKRKISHAVLNAKNHEKEAEIISKAGEKGAVTVATNMAGRGVDIKLGKGVEKLNGLYVIGTERHESRRIDNQLRGRAGRQGDPGTTKFFVSLEDDIMRLFGGDQVARVMEFLKMPEEMPIEHNLISKAIESAQKKVEGHNFDIRKHTVEYDDVMNQQREIIYGVRDQILAAAADTTASRLKDEILEKIDSEINTIVAVHAQEEIDYDKILEDFSTIILFDESSKKEMRKKLQELAHVDEMEQFLVKIAHDVYEAREKMLTPDVMRQMEIFVYLNTMDTLWIEHLDAVDDLRAGIGLRGYAQRDPLIEYKKEAFDLFERLMVAIDTDVVHKIYKVQPNAPQPVETPPVLDVSHAIEEHEEALDERNLLKELDEVQNDMAQLVENPLGDSLEHPAGTKVKVERNGQVINEYTSDDKGSIHTEKVGRNDPCPCGSGLKYKKCGLINAPQHRQQSAVA